MIKPSAAILVLSIWLLACSRSSADVAPPPIDSFESCVKAGYPVLRTFPGQCRTPDGRTFLQEVAPSAIEHLSQRAEIADFTHCLNSGFPVIEGQPRRCVVGDRTFVETPAVRQAAEPMEQSASLCVDRCGNGTCEEIVCMGSGCPCPETAESCKEDCHSN